MTMSNAREYSGRLGVFHDWALVPNCCSLFRPWKIFSTYQQSRTPSSGQGLDSQDTVAQDNAKQVLKNLSRSKKNERVTTKESEMKQVFKASETRFLSMSPSRSRVHGTGC